jgi:hypothetical protein
MNISFRVVRMVNTLKVEYPGSGNRAHVKWRPVFLTFFGVKNI